MGELQFADPSLKRGIFRGKDAVPQLPTVRVPEHEPEVPGRLHRRHSPRFPQGEATVRIDVDRLLDGDDLFGGRLVHDDPGDRQTRQHDGRHQGGQDHMDQHHPTDQTPAQRRGFQCGVSFTRWPTPARRPRASV